MRDCFRCPPLPSTVLSYSVIMNFAFMIKLYEYICPCYIYFILIYLFFIVECFNCTTIERIQHKINKLERNQKLLVCKILIHLNTY